MGPLDLAFENLNALGMWRDTEQSQAADASGHWITVEESTSVSKLKRILWRRQGDRQCDSCLSKLRVFLYESTRDISKCPLAIDILSYRKIILLVNPQENLRLRFCHCSGERFDRRRRTDRAHLRFRGQARSARLITTHG